MTGIAALLLTDAATKEMPRRWSSQGLHHLFALVGAAPPSHGSAARLSLRAVLHDNRVPFDENTATPNAVSGPFLSGFCARVCARCRSAARRRKPPHRPTPPRSPIPDPSVCEPLGANCHRLCVCVFTAVLISFTASRGVCSSALHCHRLCVCVCVYCNFIVFHCLSLCVFYCHSLPLLVCSLPFTAIQCISFCVLSLPLIACFHCISLPFPVCGVTAFSLSFPLPLLVFFYC